MLKTKKKQHDLTFTDGDFAALSSHLLIQRTLERVLGPPVVALKMICRETCYMLAKSIQLLEP